MSHPLHTVAELLPLYRQYAAENTFSQTPQSLYDPANYALSVGGKQLRPLLVLLGHQLFDANISSSLPASHAIEMFHNFTLLHDDIMDNSSIRRGEPTVHIKYNVNTAILSGDLMLIQSYRFLAEATTDPLIFKQIFDIFTKTATEICEGQQYDVDFETSNLITIPDYLQMIALKTAVLLGAALQIGALLAGSTAADAVHLYEFGLNLGVAFQIQDDLLDTFGNAENFGKRIGGDILNNKKTVLLLHAQEIADDTQKKQLQDWLDASPKNIEEEAAKIKGVTDLFHTLNIQTYTTQLKNDFYQKSLHHLAQITAEDSRKQPILQFADELMLRTV